MTVRMEYLDVVTGAGATIGKAERNEVHQKHLLHRSVHILIVNSSNAVLITRRKANKKQYPSFWHGSVGGHVISGATAATTADKELVEEIGISVPLRYLGTVIVDDDVEHELVSVYVGKSDGPFRFDHDEIADKKFIPLTELAKKMDGMRMTPHCKGALRLLLQSMEHHTDIC